MSSIFLILLFSIIQILLADTVKQKPQYLVVKEPSEKKGTKIKINVATFGDIPYGNQIPGKLYYDLQNTDDDYACKELSMQMPKKKGGNLLGMHGEMNFLMLDRGNCTFVMKARNAQNAGAQVLIIANNKKEDIDMLYMVDDGTGRDISIPTVMISFDDAEFIKNLMKNSKDVKLIIDFPLEKSDTVVVTNVLSSSQQEMYELLEGLKTVEDLLVPAQLEKSGNQFMYYPVYYTQTHPFAYFQKAEKQTFNHCYSNGEYCIFPDAEAKEMGITDGRVILKENLRQICIFEKRNNEKDFPFLLEYLSLFHTECYNSEKKRFGDECALEVMTKIMPEEKIKSIDECIKQSFNEEERDTGLPDEDQFPSRPNWVLREEKKYQEFIQAVLNPSVFVNKKLIQVSLNILLYRENTHYITY